MKKAFTMIELVFVIVVIGILTAIAIPKFSATRDDATITSAKTTLASLRSALSQETQARMMRGDYTAVTNLGGTTNTYNSAIFDYFDGNTSGNRVLEYPPLSCKSGAKGCWMRNASNQYTYYFPAAIGGSAIITLSNNRLNCTPSNKCKYLER